MFLLRKILSKFTPELNKLHLTTITLLIQTLIRFTPNCTIYSFPRLPRNGLATIALFLCYK